MEGEINTVYTSYISLILEEIYKYIYIIYIKYNYIYMIIIIMYLIRVWAICMFYICKEASHRNTKIIHMHAKILKQGREEKTLDECQSILIYYYI